MVMTKNWNGFHDHFRLADSVKGLISSSAFAGKGILLLPWDDSSRYTDEMTIADLKEQFLWHSNVSGHEMLAGINRLVDDVNDGWNVFHDIYTEEEMEAEPEKKNTGLFFLHGKKDAPFVLIVPGGSCYYAASLHTGFPFAMAFNEKGYNAFVLKYRVGAGMPDEPKAEEDLKRAIDFILENAEDFGVDPDDFALCGESVGARFCSHLVYGRADDESTERYADSVKRPCAVILECPILEGVPSFKPYDPAAFLITGQEDHLATSVELQKYGEAMEKAGAHMHLEVYEHLEHGFGTGDGTAAAGWLNEAILFWESYQVHPLSEQI